MEVRQQKHYNIMTSCDNKLAPYVAVQLHGISYSLDDSTVDFYLFYREGGVSRENLEMLFFLGDYLPNISFHAVAVLEPEKYDILASHGGGWTSEAYYSFGAHLLLPEDTDRILYIDAGDVMILGDIAPYYDCDFEEKALIVTANRYKNQQGEAVPYDGDDLADSTKRYTISVGLFNSGAYVINLKKLRDASLTMDDFVDFVEGICQICGKEDTSKLYWGDQGLLSLAYVGDLKLFGYPEIRDVMYTPYNFCMGYYNVMDTAPSYHPSIVHFPGEFKPWRGRYPATLKFFSQGDLSVRNMKSGLAEWFYLWHEHAVCVDRILEEFACFSGQ